MRPIAVLLILAGFASPAAPREARAENLKRFEYQQVLMGVPVRILVYASEESVANAAVHAAFDRIRQLNLIFSDYDEDSEISRLCRTSKPGQPVRVSRELSEVLAVSLDLSRRSHGAFDVTVGPLVDLWRKSRRSKRLPAPEALAEAKTRVGYQAVRLDPSRHTVELKKSGMRLDFGGIAKGYAANEARDVLKARGLTRALVALSGDISAGDPPPGQPGWRVAIPGGTSADDPAEEAIWLKNAAVSTSGDAHQFVEIGGRRYSHLVDPKTGLGMTRRISVTVIATKGLTADGLDSTAAILGPQEGLELIETTADACGRIIERTADDNRVVQSSRFKTYLAPPSRAAGTVSP
jgi:thiamine biosynthesis lipoprotein